MKNLTKQQKGFTIIEVLIVLAIAGLILLIVFLAVPALQRNSRNTQIKNDVQNVVGGISEYQGNNNGQTPTAILGQGDVHMNRGSGTPDQVTKVQGSTLVFSVATAPTSVPGGQVQVRLGYRCDGGQSTRAVAVYYNTETSGNASNLQCQDA